MACLPERVTGAVIAAGNTDMSWPEARTGYLQSELDIMALGDEDTAVAWCEVAGSELRVLPDCGHLSLIDRFPALAAEIVHR